MWKPATTDNWICLHDIWLESTSGINTQKLRHQVMTQGVKPALHKRLNPNSKQTDTRHKIYTFHWDQNRSWTFQWDPQVHYFVRESSSMKPTFNQMNKVYNLISCFSKIMFLVTLPSYDKVPQDTFCVWVFRLKYYLLFSSVTWCSTPAFCLLRIMDSNPRAAGPVRATRWCYEARGHTS